MPNLAEAFEEHLRSLSDSDWNALVARVRAPQRQPNPLANDDDPPDRPLANDGLEEARRRGYVDEDGKRVSR